MYDTRRDAVRACLREQDADAFIVTDPHNIRYLTCTEFLSSLATFVVLPVEKEPIAIVPSLERYRAQEHCDIADLRIYSDYPHVHSEGKNEHILLKKVLRELDATEVLSDGKLKGLKTRISKQIIEQRMKKDVGELRYIRKAAGIAKSCAQRLDDIVTGGKTEQESANALDHEMRARGASLQSFQTIVASGKHSSYPHWDCSSRKIQANEPVIVDFGASYKGYCSDITRTVFTGNVEEEVLSVYELVKTAQERAISELKVGTKIADIDMGIRTLFKEHGLAHGFVHSTGHGLGLEVHEKPRIAVTEKGTFEEGQVITIEPGIYLPGKFGIRIEDDVHIGRKVEVLSR